MSFSSRFVDLMAGLLDLYSILIIIRALMSWFMQDQRNKFYQFMVRITEPVLGPIRRIMPQLGVDLSPVVAVILIAVIISILKRIS